MRKLTLEGKITIFKSLAILKIVQLAIITKVPNTLIEELKQIQKDFLWDNKKVKMASLKCSWVKQLYTENFHDWKIIPLQYINKLFGKNFKFHSNLNIPKIPYHIFLASTKKY